jgi:hypothetical protein
VRSCGWSSSFRSSSRFIPDTDFYIAFGAAFCLAFWVQRPELEAWSAAPALRLAILMAFAALVMTNLIDLGRLGAAPIE